MFVRVKDLSSFLKFVLGKGRLGTRLSIVDKLAASCIDPYTRFVMIQDYCLLESCSLYEMRTPP